MKRLLTVLVAMLLLSMVAVASCEARPRPRPKPTPTPVPTPTPDPTPNPASVILSEGCEGSPMIWDEQKGTPWASGSQSYSRTTGIVHGGSKALLSTIDAASGEAGVRWAIWPDVQGPVPQEAYYSNWNYLPATMSRCGWFMLFQKKTVGATSGSDPVISVNLEQVGTKLRLCIYHFVGANGKYNGGGQGIKARSNVDLPIGQWFHLECFLKDAKTKTGRLTVWLDGVQVMDMNNIITEYSYDYSKRKDRFGRQPRQVAWNNYGGQIQPAPWTIIMDDFKVSTTRLGN